MLLQFLHISEFSFNGNMRQKLCKDIQFDKIFT